MDEHYSYEIEAPETAISEIVPGLWQGGGGFREPIEAGKFDYVLTLDASVHRHMPVPEGTIGFLWDIADGPMGNINVCKQWTTVMYDLWRGADKTVLIRCFMGLNRSGLIVASLLMQAGYTSQDAIDLIREKRSPYALGNHSFCEYLGTCDAS